MSEAARSLATHAAELEFDGERLVPGAVESEIELEHYHRYLATAELVAEAAVLDVACGTGYGTQILGTRAASVLGVDISHEAVEFARAHFAAPNVQFQQGSCTSLPIVDAMVDVVVSFETIEHIVDHDRFLDECRRVLKPEGLLIISTPDRQKYNAQLSKPNPHHLRELSLDEFRGLLAARFANVELASQRVVFGSLVVPNTDPASIESIYRDDSSSIHRVSASERGVYHIAVCSNGSAVTFPASVFEGSFPPNALSSLIGGINDRQQELRGLSDEKNKLVEQMSNLNQDRMRLRESVSTLQRRLIAVENELRIARERLTQALGAIKETDSRLIESRIAQQVGAMENAMLRLHFESAKLPPQSGN